MGGWFATGSGGVEAGYGQVARNKLRDSMCAGQQVQRALRRRKGSRRGKVGVRCHPACQHTPTKNPALLPAIPAECVSMPVMPARPLWGAQQQACWPGSKSSLSPPPARGTRPTFVISLPSMTSESSTRLLLASCSCLMVTARRVCCLESKLFCRQNGRGQGQRLAESTHSTGQGNELPLTNMDFGTLEQALKAHSQARRCSGLRHSLSTGVWY